MPGTARWVVLSLILLLFGFFSAERAAAQLSDATLLSPPTVCPGGLVELNYAADTAAVSPSDTLTIDLLALGPGGNSFRLASLPGNALLPVESLRLNYPETLSAANYVLRFRLAGDQIQLNDTLTFANEPRPTLSLLDTAGGVCPADSFRVQIEGDNSRDWFLNGELLQANGPANLRVAAAGTIYAEAGVGACLFRTDSLSLSFLPRPTANWDTASIPEVVCYGEVVPLPPGSGTPAGGSGTIEAWMDGAGNFDSRIAGTGAHPSYFIYTAPNGCRDSVRTTITVPQPLFPQLLDSMGNLVDFSPVCVAGPELFRIRPEAPAPDSVTWSNGTNGYSALYQAPETIFATVQDSGCTYRTDTLQTEAIELPGPPTNLQFRDGVLTGSTQAALPAVVLVFTDENLLEAPVLTDTLRNSNTFQLVLPDSLRNEERFFVAVLTDNDCSGELGPSDEIGAPGVLDPTPEDLEDNFFIPNAFSPNGDGFNDALVFGGNEDDPGGQNWLELYPNANLKVFNQWGSLVYEDSSYKNDWRATDLPDGSYFFHLELRNGAQTHKGTVRIQR